MIRKSKKSDIDQIINIWLDASIKAHGFIEKSFWQSKVQDMKEIYLPASENYVYEENNIIKAFLSLHKNTLAALFVSPDFQGTGIGTQLIKKAKSIQNNLNLTVYKENIKSINFYKKWIYNRKRTNRSTYGTYRIGNETQLITRRCSGCQGSRPATTELDR